MDAKVVDAALREHLWPQLKAAGFTRHTGRTAWRATPDAIQCLNVQSYNSYLADRMAATTYSFGVNLGVFFPAIARRSAKGAFVRDPSRPSESSCHLRRVLTKGFAQPDMPTTGWFGSAARQPNPAGWVDRPDVWLVLPDGSNVERAVLDAAERVLTEGLPWLDAVAQPNEAIRRLLEEPDVFAHRGVILETYGGRLGSPARWQAIGAMAAAYGDRALLERAVDEMTRQTFWIEHPRDLEALRAELAAVD